MTPGVDPALMQRFARAGAAIAWRPADPSAPAKARIAHLHDEEARVEATARTVTVEPGPVGALVLLLEIDRRGPPIRLEARDSGRPPFARGSLRARWGPGRDAPEARAIPLDDLVAVARYALV